MVAQTFIQEGGTRLELSYRLYSSTNNHSDVPSYASSTAFRRRVEEGGWEAEFTPVQVTASSQG